MTELKPCPFCGGEAETHEVTFPYHYWDVWCDGECFDHFCEKSTEAEAIEAWNTRAERTCRWTGSVGIGLADGAYDEESDTYHAVPVVCHHFDCGHGTITEGYEIPAFCPVCGAKVVD